MSLFSRFGNLFPSSTVHETFPVSTWLGSSGFISKSAIRPLTSVTSLGLKSPWATGVKVDQVGWSHILDTNHVSFYAVADLTQLWCQLDPFSHSSPGLTCHLAVVSCNFPFEHEGSLVDRCVQLPGKDDGFYRCRTNKDDDNPSYGVCDSGCLDADGSEYSRLLPRAELSSVLSFSSRTIHAYTCMHISMNIFVCIQWIKEATPLWLSGRLTHLESNVSPLGKVKWQQR